jgi:hypothetical protein
MTAEQGSFTSPEKAPQRLHELGVTAWMLQMDLAPMTEAMPFAHGDTPRWADSDLQAFGGYIEFELNLTHANSALGGQAESKLPDVRQVHEGLPFTDDEREWIWNQRYVGWHREPGESPSWKDGRLWWPVDSHIIKLGDRQGEDRRDLVRRWAAWRRGADEFADRATFRQAMGALFRLGVELCPEGPDLEFRASPSRGLPVV